MVGYFIALTKVIHRNLYKLRVSPVVLKLYATVPPLKHSTYHRRPPLLSNTKRRKVTNKFITNT